MKYILFSFLLVCCFQWTTCAALDNSWFVESVDSTIYVDSSATAGLNEGSSWTDAYIRLEDGLNASRINSAIDEIWVAKGTYYPTQGNQRDTSFVIRDSLKVYGGFHPSLGIDSFHERNWILNETILSGDIGNTNDFTDNVYHVIKIWQASEMTLLDGFTVEGGYGDNSSNNNDSGGGLLNDGSGNGNRSNPIITNCIFRNNRVTDNGGAIWNNGFEGEASPTITDCIFEDNSADDNGGAIDNNGAGGGISSPIINRCTFRGNHSGRFGGAVYNYGSSGNSSPYLRNCLFAGNASDENGGAMNNNGASGGSSTPIILNCTFSGNNAVNFGGAIQSFGNGASPRFINTLIWNNAALSGASVFNSGGSSASYYYSLIQGFFPPGPGVLNGFGTTNDPLFVMPVDPSQAPTKEGNYAIRYGSPVIGQGVDDSLGVNDTIDISGGLRIYGENVDIGAYEFRYEFPCGTYNSLIIDEIPIVSAEYKADSLIQSQSLVDSLSGGPVIFKSKQSIELLSNFEVKKGEVFVAKIENPCLE